MKEAVRDYLCELKIIKRGTIYTVFECSECEHIFASNKREPDSIERAKFCPNCGREIAWKREEEEK
jgi:ribosomal protein L33